MRSFADARGRVRVVERATGKEFTSGTANVFVERDYYTVSSVDAQDDHALIEGLYAKVEGVAAPIFGQLRDGAEWDANPQGPESPSPLSDRDRQMLREGEAFEIEPSREHVIEMSLRTSRR